MISTPYSLILTILISFISTFQVCDDLEFDYQSHPHHPFDIEHADIRLELEPDQHLVNGSVVYRVSSKIDGLTEIQLHAGELSLDDVLVNGVETEYQVLSDSLMIQLQDTLSRGAEFELWINWQSTSDFGLHRSYDGAFWSSMNPKAHRHWLPGFDHPREEFTVDAEITIPNGMEVLFNGDLGDVSIASENEKRVEWKSETPVPATGLGFVTGNFKISEMTAGFTKLRLFHSSVMQDQAAELVVEAARLKRIIEDELSFEFPWDALNVVVLSDNFWMERTHGSGTIYLFERLGNLEAQLARNMYLQWFGEYQRTEQYFGFGELIQTALHYQNADSMAIIENPDSLFLIDQWNDWQKSYLIESSIFTSTIGESLNGFMREFSGVVHFNDYEELWYESTGVPFFGVTPTITEEDEIESPQNSTYQVDIELDEVNSELEFIFELLEGPGDQLFDVTLIEHQFDSITNKEISFTGELDTVTVSTPIATEFVTFETFDLSGDQLYVRKAPLFFLLNQLRSQEPENRISAAKLLVNHSENPDLQLALSDILAFEENPDVIAAIYEALAVLTDGASGTEEQFISGLSNNSEAIQLASIRALKNYPENEYVRSSLRSKLIRSEGAVFETALNSYNEVASGEEMLGLVRTIQRRDTIGLRTLRILELADSLQQNEEAHLIVSEFLSDSFPYSIRTKALNHLDQFDIDFERWSERLRNLVNDRDPRIRFWTVEHAMRFKSASEALVFLNTVEIDEMDPRVLSMIELVKEELVN